MHIILIMRNNKIKKYNIQSWLNKFCINYTDKLPELKIFSEICHNYPLLCRHINRSQFFDSVTVS